MFNQRGHLVQSHKVVSVNVSPFLFENAICDVSRPASPLGFSPSRKGQEANSGRRQRWSWPSCLHHTSNRGLLSPLNHPGLIVSLLRESETGLDRKDQTRSFPRKGTVCWWPWCGGICGTPQATRLDQGGVSQSAEGQRP